MVVCGWPYAEAQAYKADVEGNFIATLELVPEFAARGSGEPSVRRRSSAARCPAGSASRTATVGRLVGDAGYNKDPITAQGITDAFLDAERCTDAIDQWLRDGKPYNDAMSAWHQERDAKAMPIYEFTAQLATLELPPPEMQQLLGAMVGNQEAMDGFVSVVSGAVSPVDFFSEENVQRIFAKSRTS